ncbi:hypothetical protein EI94DRAFT_251187 [Lactarius quietus]|nr:hypothetical protein EI94DRAFT_251187 [Lactarius quietus]
MRPLIMATFVQQKETSKDSQPSLFSKVAWGWHQQVYCVSSPFKGQNANLYPSHSACQEENHLLQDSCAHNRTGLGRHCCWSTSRLHGATKATSREQGMIFDLACVEIFLSLYHKAHAIVDERKHRSRRPALPPLAGLPSEKRNLSALDQLRKR